MVTIMGSDGGHKINETVAQVAGGLTAVVSFVNTSVAKLSLAPNANFGVKAAIAASQVLGPDIVWGIIGQGKNSIMIQGVPLTKNSLSQQSITPTGVLNKTTYAGITLLIADYVLKEFLGGKYGMRYAHPWFQSVGAGLVFGGIVGGLFDPATGIRGGATAGSGPAAVAGSRGSRTSGFQGTYSGV